MAQITVDDAAKKYQKQYPALWKHALETKNDKRDAVLLIIKIQKTVFGRGFNESYFRERAQTKTGAASLVDFYNTVSKQFLTEANHIVDKQLSKSKKADQREARGKSQGGLNANLAITIAIIGMVPLMTLLAFYQGKSISLGVASIGVLLIMAVGFFFYHRINSPKGSRGRQTAARQANRSRGTSGWGILLGGLRLAGKPSVMNLLAVLLLVGMVTILYFQINNRITRIRSSNAAQQTSQTGSQTDVYSFPAVPTGAENSNTQSNGFNNIGPMEVMTATPIPAQPAHNAAPAVSGAVPGTMPYVDTTLLSETDRQVIQNTLNTVYNNCIGLPFSMLKGRDRPEDIQNVPFSEYQKALRTASYGVAGYDFRTALLNLSAVTENPAYQNEAGVNRYAEAVSYTTVAFNGICTIVSNDLTLAFDDPSFDRVESVLGTIENADAKAREAAQAWGVSLPSTALFEIDQTGFNKVADSLQSPTQPAEQIVVVESDNQQPTGNQTQVVNPAANQGVVAQPQPPVTIYVQQPAPYANPADGSIQPVATVTGQDSVITNETVPVYGPTPVPNYYTYPGGNQVPGQGNPNYYPVYPNKIPGHLSGPVPNYNPVPVIPEVMPPEKKDNSSKR